MRPSRASTRVPVSPAYERNPAGQPIRGSGHSATFPTPDSVAVTAMGSPTRPLGGSSRRSRLSPRATAGGSPAARAPGSGSTCTGTVSLRNEKRSSRLKNEKLAGTAYSTVAGGMTIRPGASGNTASCATNRSSQRPRTRREAATSLGAAPGYDQTPSGVCSVRIGARRRRARSSRGNHATAITSSCWPTSTVSPGRSTVSATCSPGSPAAGGVAPSISRRAMGDTAVASPALALSTVTMRAAVATRRPFCSTRTGPITSAPGRCARSSSSRVVVRTGPPSASSVTSVTSRDPTTVNPVSAGRARVTGAADRVRARMVSSRSSPAATCVRSRRAVTSGAGPLCSAASTQSASITSLSRRAPRRGGSARCGRVAS